MSDTEKKIVYVVTEGCYSDYRICGVFSTRDKAQKWISDVEPYGEIEEWELDDKSGEFLATAYLSRIDLETGELTRPDPQKNRRVSPREQHQVFHPSYYGGPLGAPRRLCVTSWSIESQDHADKLCIERRQQWLREGKPNA